MRIRQRNSQQRVLDERLSMKTLREILREGKQRLEAASISPVDAELLLAHLLGVGRMELHSRQVISEEKLSSEEMQELDARFQELISERIDSIPVQYLTGEAAFRHLLLAVGPGVLIPRPETEGLVELALQWLEGESSRDYGSDESRDASFLGAAQRSKRFSVVDLGAGSGAIALSIAIEAFERGILTSVVAVEDSLDAIPWLERNIATCLEKYPEQLDIRLVQKPVSEALIGVRCDLIVSNPPYIPLGETLPADVSNEPDRALFGGVSGIETPLHFAQEAARLLKPGGALFMEHFEGQGEMLAREMAKDFESLTGHDDLNGRGRYISGVRRSG